MQIVGTAVDMAFVYYWYSRARKRGNAVGWSIAEAVAIQLGIRLAGGLIATLFGVR